MILGSVCENDFLHGLTGVCFGQGSPGITY